MGKAPAMHHELLTEATPLLPQGDQLPGQREHNNAFKVRPPRPAWQTPRLIGNLVVLVIFLASLGDRIAESPMQRINEAIICYRYYEEADPSRILLDRNTVGPGALGGVDEAFCKIDPIQDALSSLVGWQIFFDGIPCLLLAIPFGWAADKIGRKPIIAMGFFAFALKFGWVQIVTWFWQSFDVRWTWISSAAYLIGGGNMTTVSILFVSLSDITIEADRAKMFLRVVAFNILASVLMPPVVAWLMKTSPWIPDFAGTFFMIAAGLVYLIMPETLDFLPNTTPYHAVPVDDGDSDFNDPITASPKQTLFRRQLHSARRALAFLTDDWRVPAVMIPFVGHTIVGIISPLLLQYLSKRYALSIADATLALTIRSAVSAVLLFFIIPYLSKLVMRRGRLSGQRKDLYLARGSQVFLAAGWTLVGVSPNLALVSVSLVIAALGNGTATLIKSFIASIVPPHRIARTFSILGIMETIGAMAGAPLMAGLMTRGAHFSGVWIGLPFIFLGLLTSVSTIVLFIVRIRDGEDELHLTPPTSMMADDSDGPSPRNDRV